MALVAAVAILAWQAFIAFTAPPPDISISVSTERPDRTATTHQARSADYYAAMGNSLIFGEAGVVGSPGAGSRNTDASPPGSLDSLPATTLTSLKLLGTAVGMEEISTAVIGDGASVKVYKEGEKVAGSAVVEQILPNKVVLNRDGTREVLTSSLTQLSSVAPASPSTRTPAARTPAGRVSSRPDYTIVDRAEWQDRDPYEMLGQGRITPAWRDGQVEGLQLQNIADNEYAQQLGLKEGDIVRSVNGVSIRSMEEAASLAVKLQQAPVIRVEVLRDGKPETLTYRLR